MHAIIVDPSNLWSTLACNHSQSFELMLISSTDVGSCLSSRIIQVAVLFWIILFHSTTKQSKKILTVLPPDMWFLMQDEWIFLYLLCIVLIFYHTLKIAGHMEILRNVVSYKARLSKITGIKQVVYWAQICGSGF